MRRIHEERRVPWPLWGLTAALALVAALWAVAGAGLKQAPAPSPSPEMMAPVIGDTRENLQEAFNDEVNTKERYLAAAKLADQEGYPYAAQVFRACARAEQAHADQDVHAIAWTGGEAKALLQRLVLGNTAENLRVAVGLEEYEATQVYPARLAQARKEHQSEAVRSFNFALAAEREHAKLLAGALETLESRPVARALYVCPDCGKTVASVNFAHCPNCFTRANEFVRIG
jgi:rubrerythrin